MLQAYCDKRNDNGDQSFTFEWQMHSVKWQFATHDITAQMLIELIAVYEKHGIEDVQTMARWAWVNIG